MFYYVGWALYRHGIYYAFWDHYISTFFSGMRGRIKFYGVMDDFGNFVKVRISK